MVDAKGWQLEIGENAVVVAAPCTSHAGQTDLSASLPQRKPDDDRIRIGLVHGQTFDIEGHQTNFPIARGTAVDRGLDYLAIGDTHAFREVEPQARAPTVYPGAPEATNFGERDTGNVAVVFFPLDRRRRAIVRPETVGSWTWRDETCTSISALRAVRADPNLRRTVLRLTLDMEVPMAEYDEAERILDELAGSMAATPRVGVLDVHRQDLRLARPRRSTRRQLARCTEGGGGTTASTCGNRARASRSCLAPSLSPRSGDRLSTMWIRRLEVTHCAGIAAAASTLHPV